MLACSSNQPDDAPQCAFYGRHVAFDRIFNQGGNQCALITSTSAPCIMDVAGQRAHWPSCFRNPERNGSYEHLSTRRVEPSAEDRARAESYAAPALDLTRRADA